MHRSNNCYGPRVRGLTLRPLALALMTGAPLAAQGLTTAAVEGRVTGREGLPLGAQPWFQAIFLRVS